MFGFNSISEITHDLENIYDLIRQGNKNINEEIISITLQSSDHLRNLLADQEFKEPENINLQKELIKRLDIIVNAGSQTYPDIPDASSAPSVEFKSYYIYFEPFADLLKNGNNPLFLLDEIAGLGKTVVYQHSHNVPALKELDPSKCYISWEIILSTQYSINSISDVFIFVEDECKLEIQFLENHDIFENQNVVNQLNRLKEKEQQNYFTSIKNILNKAAKFTPKSYGKQTALKKENLISSVRVSSEKLDNLMNLVSELVTTQARLTLFAENEGKAELLTISENVQKLSKQLRDIAFDIVLIPIDTVVTRFHRLVRDLSNELNKKVNFITHGTETELDKTIIENLTDPLLHILRNCIDHGIESPEERKRKGKKEEGTILLNAFYSGTNVKIEIFDDGVGIDPDKIKEKAIKNGLITEEQLLKKSDIFDLIFLHGFSTASKITDVSGRGVGMDVVRRKIAEIRGEVKVNSEINKGTTITIILPLTLSIIDGLLVKIGDVHYIIPLSAVNKIYAVSHDKILKSFNNHIKLDGKLFPFFYLRSEFNINHNNINNEQLILTQYQEKQVGIIVDNVIGEYQAVLKPLGKHYKEQDMISGATILGDGTVALVMDTNKMISNFIAKDLISEEKI